ncbi:MAG: alpha/beta fold hydrolase [Pseudomonadota bacterium]
MLTLVLTSVLAAYALACIALFLMQRSMIYFPQPRTLATPVMALEVPGARLNVSVLPRAGAKALVYFGGNAEDVAASLPSLARLFPQHALYLMHYRGYGGSTGKPTEAALAADALALFDRVHAQHPQVLAMGRSLGSGLAVRLASMRPVSRLVLVTPYDSIAAIAAGQFPYFPVRWLLTDKFESWRYAPKVGAPTTILAAQNDTLIPPASSRQLQARFKPGLASYVLVPDAGHNTISGEPVYEAALAQIARE